MCSANAVSGLLTGIRSRLVESGAKTGIGQRILLTCSRVAGRASSTSDAV
jgi:hypothetical protein